MNRFENEDTVNFDFFLEYCILTIWKTLCLYYSKQD